MFKRLARSSKSSVFVRIAAGLAVALLASAVLSSGEARAEEKAEAAPERKFNDVLNDLLDEFSYDLKTNEVPDLRNVSVRKVALSEAVPRTYEPYLESLANERLRKFSKMKVIQCANCRVRRSAVENGRVTISTPVNNPQELDALARSLNVDTWLDVGLLYQQSAMLLSVNAFDSRTKELLWSKVYNSEAIYQKRSLNAAGGKDAEGEKPKTSSMYGITAGYSLVPNVKKPAQMVHLGLRFSEKFNETRSEVGALLTAVVDPAKIISTYPGVSGDPSAIGEATNGTTTSTIKPFTYGLGLFAVYYHNFIKVPEDFDLLRFGAHAGFGGIVSMGYLAITTRLGGVMKFGKSWVLEAGLLYSLPTTISLAEDLIYKTTGGMGGEISFGLLL